MFKMGGGKARLDLSTALTSFAGTLTKWQRRLFVLKSGMLSWYDDEQAPTPLKSVAADHTLQVQVLEASSLASLDPGATPGSAYFSLQRWSQVSLKPMSKKWVIRAASQAEMAQWLEALSLHEVQVPAKFAASASAIRAFQGLDEPSTAGVTRSKSGKKKSKKLCEVCGENKQAMRVKLKSRPTPTAVCAMCATQIVSKSKGIDVPLRGVSKRVVTEGEGSSRAGRPAAPTGAAHSGKRRRRPVVDGNDWSDDEDDDMTLIEQGVDVAEDAAALRKAIKGLGTTDSVLIDIIGNRHRATLQRIAASYREQFDRSLEDDVKGDTSGHYEELLIARLRHLGELNARLVRKAVKGLGTNENLLVEVLATRSQQELADAVVAYDRLYPGRVLQDDVASDTSGDFKKCLTALIHGADRSKEEANAERAKQDADRLYKAGAARLGTDEDVFVEILTSASRRHIRAISYAYIDRTGKTLASAIESEFSGDLRKALRLLVRRPVDYYAEALRKAVKGLGTNDDALVRVLGYLSRRKLRLVAKHYLHTYDRMLIEDLEDDTSFNFKKLIRAVTPRMLSDPPLPPDRPWPHPSTALPSSYSPAADAERLRKAMKGLGTNESELIDIIGSRSRAQLQAVRAAFADAYERDLIADVRSETSGNFRKLLVYRLQSHGEATAVLLHEAIAGLGTDDALLREVLVTRLPSELAAAAPFYEQQYKETVTAAIAGDTSGDYRKLCVELAKTRDRPDRGLDVRVAIADAEALYKAGAARMGTDEEAIIKILSSRSPEHLEAVGLAYADATGKTLEAALRSETSGNFRKVLMALVKPRDMLFAELVRKAVKGLGTNDDLLTRVLGYLSHGQARAVGRTYADMFGRSMAKDVASDTSGDYRKLAEQCIGTLV